MSYNLKNIILPVIICMVMGSCTSDHDPGSPASRSQEEMRFEIAGATRVNATTENNIIDLPFMLFGDVSSSAGYFEGVKPIFNWDSVAYDKDKKVWDYNGGDEKNRQYWFMGQEHSFVAIHPFIEKGDSQVTVLEYKDNELSFTYTLPDEMADACDLLFATHRRKYTLDTAGPVKFQFRHLLARINISLALEEKELMYDNVNEKDFIDRDASTATVSDKNVMVNEYIKVHSIEFNGIKTKASFTFYPKKLEGTANYTYDYEKTYMIRDDDRIEKKTVTLVNPNPVYNSYKKNPDDNQPRNASGNDTDNGSVYGTDNESGDVSGSEPGSQTGEETGYEIKYTLALTDQEVIVMLPQAFGSDSEATMVVNYSINDDKDLMRRIVIPLKDTEWKEGVSYTYKFLIDNAYYEHVKEGVIEVDIDDFRLPEDSDHYWITDDEDDNHNIKYGYDNEGNCGPIKKEEK